MLLLIVLSALALCNAETTTLGAGNGTKLRKQQEGVESLLRQIGEMGMLLENYRRVILSGITEATDLCGFIEKLSDIEGVDDKIPDGNLISFLIV